MTAPDQNLRLERNWGRLFRVLTYLVFSTCLFSQVAFAEHYALFQAPGVESENYAALSEKIQAGDSVSFSNGKTFEILAVLGSGQTTRVFDIGKGLALRVPKHEYSRFINATLDGYQRLHENGIPTPEVHLDQSLRSEYVLVQKVSVDTTLDVIIKKRMLQGELKEKLIAFLASTFRLREIGDFKWDQIAWTGSGWILLDWTNIERFAQTIEDNTVMQCMGWTSIPSVDERAELAIREKRKAAGFPTDAEYDCNAALTR